MIYLDHNATTPVDPAVVERMALFLREHFGNPSSLYPIGRKVKELMTEARERVAASLGVDRGEIFFTGSGTESDNFAVFGTIEASPGKDEFITSAIEHPAVLEAAKAIEKRGAKVTYLPVDRFGTVSLDALRTALTPKTALVSVMHANNEIGTIEPISDIVRISHERPRGERPKGTRPARKAGRDPQTRHRGEDPRGQVQRPP
jgi:cysteine desulfurase